MTGKTALITGAARGIGHAIAKALSAEGARVIVTDREGDAVTQSAKALPGPVLARALDITDTGAILELSLSLEKEGWAPDVLVNNAAAITVGDLLHTDPAALRMVFAVNVEGTFAVTKAFLPGMIARGEGTVLNMASLAGIHAMRDRFAYGATKAAIVQMTKSIAVDFVARGIRANCICPARVRTEFIEDYVNAHYADRAESYLEALERYQPIGRMVEPAEVAAMALYLCAPESAAVTGGVFVIDGGVTAGDGPGAP
ncbi:MAG: SDR family oxidoreductase [Rhodospirillum sp.]|nr:SDR family oxidoreductase [Rhodospirillum sp.]MCF8488571.1 SDR family oxidoreductase [Rhodospirillum sp.]MCF8499167.1 SDR family oxidoreductase [Rhodospirillum sp.]